MPRFVAKLTDASTPIKLNLDFVLEIQAVLNPQHDIIAYDCFGIFGNLLGRIDAQDFHRVINFQPAIPITLPAPLAIHLESSPGDGSTGTES
jgi:hypothetical protein